MLEDFFSSYEEMSFLLEPGKAWSHNVYGDHLNEGEGNRNDDHVQIGKLRPAQGGRTYQRNCIKCITSIMSSNTVLTAGAPTYAKNKYSFSEAIALYEKPWSFPIYCDASQVHGSLQFDVYNEI